MLDTLGRELIGKEVLERTGYLKPQEAVNIFLDRKERKILLMPEDIKSYGQFYWIATHKIDTKTRVSIPIQIRKAYPNATYLTAERHGKIYILIENA